jgi:LPXTG-site transpeptidase (sortase) family protein
MMMSTKRIFYIAVIFALMFQIGCSRTENPPTGETASGSHDPAGETSSGGHNDPAVHETDAPTEMADPSPETSASVQNAPSASSKPAKFSVEVPPIPSVFNRGLIPSRLQIPAIGLDTTVEKVGVLANGQMGVPKSYDTVGWFEPGYALGQAGNAVLAGHLDHYTGPAIFFNLKKLKPGDRVIVSDQQGKTLTFVVTRVENYKTEQSPIEQIFGPSTKPHLNLITCAGTFNKKTQESDERLVVYTDLVEETS